MSAWDHLPNSAHIHRIIRILMTSTDYWNKRGNKEYIKVWDLVAAESAKSGRMKYVFTVWEEMWNIPGRPDINEYNNLAYEYSRGIILALATFDDCAYMIDSDPNELDLLGMLGDYRAVLLKPYAEYLLTINTEL